MKSISLQKSSFDLIELYLISKNLSHEIIMEEYLQSRGANYSVLSENYAKSKKQFKIKAIITKLFYALIFGVLPIIPLFAYFEYINIITSGGYEFEFLIFSISILYGIFFLLQFFNFLLMTIMETTVVMSGKSMGWFKTLPLSDTTLKRILYVTIFRTFDIPILTIIFAFPVSLLIITTNIFFFLISLGISIINTFLGLNILIIISGRLNRILNLNDISSKKSFLIRLLNVFSYTFIILGSIYLIQWASTSMGEFFSIFISLESSPLINIILSIIPYPFSQSYLIALIFSPPGGNIFLLISTFIGMGLLLLIFYFSFYGAFKAINRVIRSEPLFKNRDLFLENLKESCKIKIKSPFIALVKKDLLSVTRDLKSFLSLISPVVFSFIFVIYLNLPNISTIEPIEIQVFKVWLSYLLLTPVLTGIIVFSLLNLDASGQTILESLPLVPRKQAKSKLFIMFITLTFSIVLPSLLFITNTRFYIFLLGILATLPIAWIFLLLSFDLSIYFFGKRHEYYIVSDLNGRTSFMWVVILIIPLSICIWIISFSSLLFVYSESFFQFFTGFISAILIGGYLFLVLFFNKLLPNVDFKIDRSLNSEVDNKFGKIERPNFFTRHVWVSVITLLTINFIFLIVGYLVSNLLYLIIPMPRIEYLDNPGAILDYLLYFAYYYVPLLVYNVLFIIIYFIFIPKNIGIPYGRKQPKRFLDEIGLGWMKEGIKSSRYVILGLILIILLLLFVLFISNPYSISYYFYENFFLFSTINQVIWSEIVYRGILLNLLRTRYKDRIANLLHSLTVFGYIFFIPLLLVSPFNLLYFLDFLYLFQFIITGLIFLSFHFIMGYIFIKTKSLLPNIIIIILISFLFSSTGIITPFLFSPFLLSEFSVSRLFLLV